MALTQKQIQELDIASRRGTATDIKNVEYAMQKHGYKPPTPPKPTVKTPTYTKAPTKGLSEKQIQELDIASQRLTPTDVKNIEYAKKKFGYEYKPKPKVRKPSPVRTTQPARKEIQRAKDEIDATKERFAEADQIAQDQALKTDYQQDIRGIYDQQVAALENEYAQFNNALEQRKATLADRNKRTIEQIQATFARRKEEMKIMNSNRQSGLKIMGARSGRQRYASEIQSGIISAEEKEGIERLASLDAQEQQLILQAERAMEDEQFGLVMEQMSLAVQLRKEKDQALNNLMSQAMQAEQIAINKAKEEREFMKFQLDVAKFNEDVKQQGIDNAIKVAEANGQRLGFDEVGNITVMEGLTFENQLKMDKFMFDVEKFGWDKTMDQANFELKEQGFWLDTQKFQQDKMEFGMEYALKEQNFSLEQQKHYKQRWESGLPTTYDQLGILAPYSKVSDATGQALLMGAQEYAGTTGPLKKQQGKKGWECAAFAEQLVDLGTPGNVMGSLMSEKWNTLEQYGVVRADIGSSGGFAVGDVIVTDGSDVSRSKMPTKYGHVAVVTSVNSDGTLTLLEANRRGDGQITTDRKLSATDTSISGLFRGQLQPKYSDMANELAQTNLYEGVRQNMSQEGVKAMIDLHKQAKGDDDIKGYIESRDAYQRVLASSESADSAGDVALIFNYMKLLDPGSVVREGEFKMLETSGSVLTRGYNSFQKQWNGKKLTDEQRNSIVARAEKIYKAKEGNYYEAMDFYQGMSNAAGVDFDLVMRDLSKTVYNSNPGQNYFQTENATQDPYSGGYTSWDAYSTPSNIPAENVYSAYTTAEGGMSVAPQQDTGIQIGQKQKGLVQGLKDFFGGLKWSW